MPRATGFTLTREAALGLFFIQRYRFLTADQFARASGMKRPSAANHLRSMETAGFLGHFGNTGHPGYGKTPKVYFLTRRGWEFLKREAGLPDEIIGSYKEIHVETRWSPVMFHRLRTVDVMLSAEVAVRRRSTLSMVQTFLEYKRVKKGLYVQRETSDFVATPEVPANRIIPDGVFIIENIESKRRALFLVEMDMATMRIVSDITRDQRLTLFYKLNQYDRYLQSLRYRQTYQEWGEFAFFTLLFVTFGESRIEHIRREASKLAPQLAQYYRFTTFDRAMGDLFTSIWLSRDASDMDRYPLVAGG